MTAQADDKPNHGIELPDSTLLDEEGAPTSLRSFRGKKVILYFYPKDDTPGCTREACDFRDRYERFREQGAEILGVSPDSSASHKKFREKYGLPFKLLSDPEKELASHFGVYKERTMYGKRSMGIERSTFVIDEEGRVVKEYRKVKVDGHADRLLDE